jgi:pyridoxamine 5'-phosphate oxidase
MSTPDARRVEYLRGALRRQDLNPDPIEQFATWFKQACDAQVVIPDAMSLATVSADGQPSLRTVLLKNYDHQGFVFFTNLGSRKAREIAANARVSLLFPWLALERQVIVTGVAERVGAAEALKYFITRPRGSQISAWASAQSSVVESRKVLEMQWEQLRQKFASGDIPLPTFWGGYRVKPAQIEFWQGRGDRLHDRFLYSRDDASGPWQIQRLAP